jgi:hypothetical protein
MTRQCLYCAKEIVKSSTSNFCSKECWTEYKKLKAMSIDADKQATVMLKRTDMPNSEPRYEERPPQQLPRSQETPPPGSFDVHKRMELFEKSVNDKLIDMTNSIKNIEPKHSSSNLDSEESQDILSRIAKLETELEGIDQIVKAASKLEDRILAMEKRLRQINVAESNEKRGFFARLFG